MGMDSPAGASRVPARGDEPRDPRGTPERTPMYGRSQVLDLPPSRQHGWSGYKVGCRCSTCRAGNTARVRQYRKGKRDREKRVA
jgi:hypothetical protein